MMDFALHNMEEDGSSQGVGRLSGDDGRSAGCYSGEAL